MERTVSFAADAQGDLGDADRVTPWEALGALSDAVLAISAETDLEAVLQTIASQAQASVGARYAALGIPHPDSGLIEHFVVAGLSNEEVEAIGELPRGRGVLGVMLNAETPLRLDDIAAHPKTFGFPPNHPPMHSFLGVPVRRAGVVVGALYLTEKIGAAGFSAEDEELVKVLARHAGIAVINARLYESLSASERRYRLLTERAPEIVLTADAHGVIKYVNARAGEMLGGDSTDYVGRALRDVAVIEDGPLVDIHLRAMASGAPLVSFAMRALDVHGKAHDLEMSLVPDGREDGGYQGIARDVTERHALTRDMAERSKELLLTRREGERLREFVALFIQAQEDERARIAGDLHDTTVQTLTAIGRRLHGLASNTAMPATEGSESEDDLPTELAELAEAALAEADEVRRLSRNLRPSTLDHLGLEAALQGLCRPLRDDGLDVRLEVDGEAKRLSSAVRTALFRIAQEALTNVRRHSEASSVQLKLHVGDEGVELCVSDDGSGFDPEATAERGARTDLGGLGLVGMRERAAMMGGELRVESAAEDGTMVTARWPLLN